MTWRATDPVQDYGLEIEQEAQPEKTLARVQYITGLMWGCSQSRVGLLS